MTQPIKQMISSIYFKIILFICAFLGVFLIPIYSHANFTDTTYWLQTFIDTNTNTYMYNVAADKASAYNAINSNAMYHQASLLMDSGSFWAFAQGDDGSSINPTAHASYLKADYQKYVMTADTSQTGSVNDSAPLSFPYKDPGDGTTASTVDESRAEFVGQNLTNSLNNACLYVNGNRTFDDPKELMMVANAIVSRKTINYNGTTYSISTTPPSGYEVSAVSDALFGVNSSDYIYITKAGGETKSFLYRLHKGYRSDNRTKGATIAIGKQDASFANSDVTYVTINDLAFQANFEYLQNGSTSANAQADTGSSITKVLTGLLNDILDGIRNALGLYSINDLMLNKGVRGGDSMFYGIFSTSWYSAVSKYFVLCMMFAFLLVSVAIIKMLIQRSLATANVTSRVSLFEGLRDLVITAFLLPGILVVINFLAYLNFSVVNIFSAYTPQGLNFANSSAASSAGIGGIVLAFAYFFIDIYINFVYIMRAVTVALLMASAPFFVVSIAFGGKFRSLFVTWIKEIVSNIFLQSFHVLIMGLLLAASASASGIEQIIMVAAFIPMTEFFKKIITGGSGIAGSLGMQSLAAAGGALAGTSIGRDSFHSQNAKLGHEPKAGGAAAGMASGAAGMGRTVAGASGGGGFASGFAGMAAGAAGTAAGGGKAAFARSAGSAALHGMSAFTKAGLAAGAAIGTGGQMNDFTRNMASSAGRSTAKSRHHVGQAGGMVTDKMSQIKDNADATKRASQNDGIASHFNNNPADDITPPDTIRRDDAGNEMVQQDADGNFDELHDGDLLNKTGVTGFSTNGNATQVDYDLNHMPKMYQERLRNIATLSRDERAQLGITGMSTDNENIANIQNMSLQFDKHGMENMGAQKIYNASDGVHIVRNRNMNRRFEPVIDVTDPSLPHAFSAPANRRR